MTANGMHCADTGCCLSGNQAYVEDNNESVTVEALIKTTSEPYRISDDGKNSDDNNSVVKTVFVGTSPESFPGKCYKCGNIRHRASQIQEKRTAARMV